MADYLKIPELARRLDVSEKTARRYVKEGVLPSVFIGGAYRVSEEDLDDYLQGAKVQPGKAPGPVQQLELEEQVGANEEQQAVPITEASEPRPAPLPGLKVARERRGVSINELSVRTGLEASVISGLESEDRSADYVTINLLAENLDDCYRLELKLPPGSVDFDALQAKHLGERARKEFEKLDTVVSLPTPAGRRYADAIDALVEQQAREQPDAG